MTDKQLEKRIKELTKKQPITPAPKEIFQLVRHITDNSVATDIVEATSEELYCFSQYWKDPNKSNKAVQAGLIPADLLIEKTIPITDIIIKNDGGVSLRVTIDLPDDDIEKAYSLLPDGHEANSILIGAVTFLEAELVFPLTIDMKTRAIAVLGEVSAIGMSYNQFERIQKKLYQNIDSSMTETILYLLGMMMPAWYGIQLALLHPVTKQIFANPKKEKRDRKERLKPVPCKNKKPKSVKYIRHHIINEDNCIDNYIDLALEQLSKKSSNNTEKRSYERHTALWRVIGHYRTYKSGKTVWVKPYWKGILKDIGGVDANNRIVDIPDKV